jgi:2-oxoglutarate ferredoxin oxidoreductase subunit alpha
MKAVEALQVVVGGEAGQGLVTVGQVLAKALVRSGYRIVVTQGYQSRIRGGHNTFTVRASVAEILAPRESIDLLVALDGVSVALHEKEVPATGLIVADRAWVGTNAPRFLGVPFAELGPQRMVNTLALGVAGALLGLPQGVLTAALDDLFGGKALSVVEENRQALIKGMEWARTQSTAFPPLAPAVEGPRRLMLNGNEALALGALSAGLKFFAFYPMTPSTSIALFLAHHAEKMGMIVEQAEDEIAAVNMAIGASFAGAPSMVATSGGGFALMVEGVSLAAMTETPLVIVVAQRPAPATGLPTRTEQGDLDFVLHAGHGEFPRAVFAPGSVEECFHLTRLALESAEASQGPVFVLTDQFLADSYRAVSPFPLEGLSWVNPMDPLKEIPLPYQRYRLSESGLSPRLLPGLSDHLVVADSDEHTEDGHLTEDLLVRKKMVEKRWAKGVWLKSRALAPDYRGDPNPDLLLVTWGSSRGAVVEAADTLKQRGKRVSVLSFSQIWPMVPNLFLPFLEAAEKVVSVEGNLTGQLARLIRRETGFFITQRIGRYDGLPITPEYILRHLPE